MAVKKKTTKKAIKKRPPKVVEVKLSAAASKLPSVPITDVVTSNFVDYGTWTLLERAIPDFRDGLKPVHRRLVWAAYAKGILPSKSYSKCATIVGECLVAGTKILTRNGLEPIEELKVGDAVATRRGLRAVTKVFKNNPEPVLRISTRHGGITASRTHPMLVLRNLRLRWIKASHIKVGDCLIKYNSANRQTLRKCSQKDAAICYLAGHFAGNGSLSFNKGIPRVSFCSPNEGSIGHVEHCLNVLNLDGYNTSSRDSKTTDGEVLHEVTCHSTESRKLISLLNLNKDSKADTKSISPHLMSKGTGLFHLVSGLIDTDGHVNIGDRKRDIVYSTSSVALRDQVVDLAAAFGTSPIVRSVPPSGASRLTNHVITISGIDTWKMLRYLPLHNTNRAVTDDQLELAKTSRNTVRNTIPGLAKLLQSVVRRHKVGLGLIDQGKYRHRTSGDIFHINLRYNKTGYIFKPNRSNITTSTLRDTNIVEFLHVLGYHNTAHALSILREHEVGIERVVSVTRSKPEPTYDVEVDDAHEFIANGYVSHNCMGHYHPVGDQAIYGALVTLINSVAPLFQGEGNLGNPALGIKPAQMRYPEAKLSQESVDWLLDPSGLAVTDMVPNFDGNKEEPVVLPARLPLVLINGASGISVGATTEIPTFHVDSIIKLLTLAITRKGYAVTAEECAKTLKLINRDGGVVLSSKKELAAAWEAGQGAIRWRCDYETDAKAKTVTITGFAPGWARTVLDKIRDMASVKHVHDLSSSGRLRIEIAIKPSAIKASGFEALIEPILKKLESRITYRLNVTERWKEVDEFGLPKVEAKFYSNGVTNGLPGLVAKWLEWRVDMVRKIAGYHKKQFAEKRRREEVLLLAINNLTEIAKILTSSTIKDKRAAIAKKLKITADEADIIWNTPIGRFDRMTSTDQKKKITDLAKKEKAAAADEKRPAKATERDILSIRAPEPNSQSYTPRNSGYAAKKKRASRKKAA